MLQTCPSNKTTAVCYINCRLSCTEKERRACPIGSKQKRPRIGGAVTRTSLFRENRGKR
jgi:hypothetical protein